MNENNRTLLQGVWFVYDGECPICDYAAQALRIKQQYGALHLLDARSAQDHPLLQAINLRGMDIDEGMVIYCNGEYYHGESALQFMAHYGEPQGWFNRVNRLLFQWKPLAVLLYPWMRGVRNWLLKQRHVKRIDNLHQNSIPIFESVFGEDWHDLPIVFKKHYANHPYSNDHIIVHGIMDVECHGMMKILTPFYRLLGIVPAVSERQVPVTVHFESEADSKAFRFNRQFHFQHRRPYRFCSRMQVLHDNELIEIMGFGICWCLRYIWRDNKVILEHRGYALNWFGHLLPVPLDWLIGTGDATETAIDDDHFDMEVNLNHRIFGHLYRYSGRFKVIKEIKEV